MGFEPRIVRPDDEEHGSDLQAGSGLPDARISELRVSDSAWADSRLHELPPREPRLAEVRAAGSDRIVLRPDDPELPSDLEELAVQLSADAALLEQRYPAAKAGQRHQEPLWQRLFRVTAAAMLVFGSVWWVSHRRADEHRAPTARSDSPALGAAGSASDTAVAADLNAPDSAVRPGAASGSSIGSALRTFESDGTVRAGSTHSVRTADPASASPNASPEAGAAQAGVASEVAHIRPRSVVPPSVRVAADHSRSGRRVGHIAELAFDTAAVLPDPAPRDRLGMLEAQLSAFEKVIAKLQAEVRRRDQLLEESSELIKTLSAEVQSLRQQQTAAEQDGAKSDEARRDGAKPENTNIHKSASANP